MAGKTLGEWIEIYEKKAQVKYETPDERVRRFYFADRGFAEIGATEKMVIIHQMCGDAKFWKQVAEALAMERGIKHLGTWCIRKIEPYIRFFNVEIEKVEELGEGLKRYHGKFKDSGKSAIFTPDFKARNGNIGYLVTWEI